MAARRFRAALTSRSWTAPHKHTHDRSDRVRWALTAPHLEHVLELGYQRSAVHTFDEYQPALYCNCRTNSPNPASETARESLRLRTIPATCSDSTAMARLVLASLVVS